MARPRKNTSPDDAPITEEVNTILVDEHSDTPVVNTPVETPVDTPVETPVPAEPEVILPESDRIEMDRYFRVINTSNQASRISQAISHQRDLQMWGIHQYDNNTSRNSYARSFYFKNRENAVKALEYANSMLG
jgi:hypothetical protein